MFPKNVITQLALSSKTRVLKTGQWRRVDTLNTAIAGLRMNDLKILSARIFTAQFARTYSKIQSCALRTNIYFAEPVSASISPGLRDVRSTCMEPLTVETLRVPPRIMFSCLSEFKISCDFHDRGCRQLVQQTKLEQHVKECGFSLAICSKEGCHVEVNARDLIHHETTVCKKRRVQCNNCAELKQKMMAVKEKFSIATKETGWN